MFVNAVRETPRSCSAGCWRRCTTRGRGKLNRKGGSLAWLRLDPELSAVVANDLAADGQAKPGSNTFPFGGEECVKETWEVLRQNTWTVVADAYDDLIAKTLGSDD